VAGTVLAAVRAADDAAQDLRVPRLRELRHEAHAVGPKRLPEDLRDLVLHRARELGPGLVSGPQHGEDHDDLAFDLVRDADSGGFRHRGVRDRGRFDPGRPCSATTSAAMPGQGPANEPGWIGVQVVHPTIPPETSVPPE